MAAWEIEYFFFLFNVQKGALDEKERVREKNKCCLTGLKVYVAIFNCGHHGYFFVV